MNEKRLVKKAQRGDKEAFTALIKKYELSLYRISFSILRSNVDCMDATQEAILKTYESISGLKKLESFKSWLFQIVVNECYATLRQRSKVVLMDKEKVVPYEESQFSNLEFFQLVNELDEEFRMVIILFYYEDLQINTIANITGVSVNTVKTRLHRGRAKLKEILNKEKENEVKNSHGR
ncbi:sigma-70 family RNA polymerase sigma factor [Bacillus sp. HMF5848]|uniref:sigma-70 family RNA polymerase sigma factor n=1 Tax=Bacillus sp. HMF5848 TaxID=2495421 RepID=UPI00163B2254|nr:sigma-70 family RNA polymerase sigma factor [Bacillus sp. HMF5848]